MNEHTPGPWHLEPAHLTAFTIVASGGRLDATTIAGRIADISLIPESWGSSEANARLIAAAPSLLEALERMLLLCNDEGHDGFCNLLLGESECTCGAEQARAAIAKATGGEP